MVLGIPPPPACTGDFDPIAEGRDPLIIGLSFGQAQRADGPLDELHDNRVGQHITGVMRDGSGID